MLLWAVAVGLLVVLGLLGRSVANLLGCWLLAARLGTRLGGLGPVEPLEDLVGDPGPSPVQRDVEQDPQVRGLVDVPRRRQLSVQPASDFSREPERGEIYAWAHPSSGSESPKRTMSKPSTLPS